MTAPEFSRPVRVDTIGESPRAFEIAADQVERAALARRFGLIAIDALAAAFTLTRTDADVALHGTLKASVTQACAATGAPVHVEIEVPLELWFRPQPEAAQGGEEIELGEDDLEITFYDSAEIDPGEAVAETLSLSLDPYPRAPGAEQALKAAGVKNEEEAGPFGALAGLRDKLTK